MRIPEHLARFALLHSQSACQAAEYSRRHTDIVLKREYATILDSSLVVPPSEDVTVALEEQSAASLRRLPRALAEVNRTEGDVKHLASSVETILHKLEASTEHLSGALVDAACLPDHAPPRRIGPAVLTLPRSSCACTYVSSQSAEATSAASVASLAAVDKVKRRMVRPPPPHPRTGPLCVSENAFYSSCDSALGRLVENTRARSVRLDADTQSVPLLSVLLVQESARDTLQEAAGLADLLERSEEARWQPAGFGTLASWDFKLLHFFLLLPVPVFVCLFVPEGGRLRALRCR